MYHVPPTYGLEPVAGRRSPRYWARWLLASLAVGAGSVLLARLATAQAGMADPLSHGYAAGLLAGTLLGSYASGFLAPCRPGHKRALLAAALPALGAACLGALLVWAAGDWRYTLGAGQGHWPLWASSWTLGASPAVLVAYKLVCLAELLIAHEQHS